MDRDCDVPMRYKDLGKYPRFLVPTRSGFQRFAGEAINAVGLRIDVFPSYLYTDIDRRPIAGFERVSEIG